MSATLSLAQMVDLALGTPEVGAVNFNVLHGLLHSVLNKLNIANDQASVDEADREFLTRQKGEDGQDGTEGTNGQSSPVRSQSSPYHQMEKKLADIEEQLASLNNLPSNDALFQRSRSSEDKPRPVTDMWQQMQLAKRVDANEAGINKLMSLVQDMMTEMNELKDMKNDIKGLKDLYNDIQKQLAEVKDMSDLKNKLKSLEDQMNDLNNQMSQFPSPEEFNNLVTWEGLESALKGMKQELQPAERVVIEMSSQTEPQSRPASARSRMSTPGPSNELMEVLERLGKLNDKHDSLDKRVTDIEEELKNKADKDALEGIGVPEDLLEQLKAMQDDLDRVKKSRDKDSDALTRMQQAILNLQAELERLSNTTQRILDDNSEKQKQIESLFEITTKLGEIKADKEFVQNEVDVKADKRHLDSKVNRTTFDTTCDELSKMISEILGKLSGHEGEWRKALEQLSEDLDGKLDRLEFGPFKEELEKTLRALKNKLKQVDFSSFLDSDEAAGLRKQIMKFNCISCDRPVDMVPQGPMPSIPVNSGLPATKSARPYTTFELDQIRQQSKSLSMGKNMTNFEHAVAGRQLARTRKKDLQAFLVHFGKDMKGYPPLGQSVFYLGCNARTSFPSPNMEVMDLYAQTRACGGSHTLTYPHRRITRMNHISTMFREEELIPTVSPLTKEEMDIQGADGHIYKGRAHDRLPNVHSSQGGPVEKGGPPQMPQRAATHTPARPRTPGRPTSARLTNRPQSARGTVLILDEDRPSSRQREHEIMVPNPLAPSEPDVQDPPPPRTPTPN